MISVYSVGGNCCASRRSVGITGKSGGEGDKKARDLAAVTRDGQLGRSSGQKLLPVRPMLDARAVQQSQRSATCKTKSVRRCRAARSTQHELYRPACDNRLLHTRAARPLSRLVQSAARQRPQPIRPFATAECAVTKHHARTSTFACVALSCRTSLAAPRIRARLRAIISTQYGAPGVAFHSTGSGHRQAVLRQPCNSRAHVSQRGSPCAARGGFRIRSLGPHKGPARRRSRAAHARPSSAASLPCRRSSAARRRPNTLSRGAHRNSTHRDRQSLGLSTARPGAHPCTAA